jgi:pimeloyl-ACP methyl ester carboxylesterase
MFKPFIAGVLCVLTGCAASQQSRDFYRAAAAPTASVSAVVFVANGAGDSRAASKNLATAATAASAPLQVEGFRWSHGDNRVLADQIDQDNHRAQGRRLAALVIAYRQAHPSRRVYLLGHSAGGAVVLSAAEWLPPNSIDRMVLLSPSVCTDYDLRPALAASREGIDHFYSKLDRWVLGLGMRAIGATDGDCGVAAGRVGFQSYAHTVTDAALYAKLRQHPWDLSAQWTGHYGGHFGNIEPRFLRHYVVPLFGD